MTLLGLIFFSNQYLSNTYRNNHFSIRILEQYTQPEFYTQSPFKPNLQVVHQQISQLKDQQNQLNSALNKFGLIYRIFIVIQLIALFYLTFKYKPSAFDGILVSSFPLISACFILMVSGYFNHQFLEGERANDQLIRSTFYLLFISTPIFSYAGFQLNNREIQHNLHQQKWMSYLCLVFFIISSAGLIISLFGLLLVPDISNFKN